MIIKPFDLIVHATSLGDKWRIRHRSEIEHVQAPATVGLAFKRYVITGVRYAIQASHPRFFADVPSLL